MVMFGATFYNLVSICVKKAKQLLGISYQIIKSQDFKQCMTLTPFLILRFAVYFNKIGCNSLKSKKRQGGARNTPYLSGCVFRHNSAASTTVQT